MSKLRKQSLHIDIGKRHQSLISEDEHESAEVKSRKSSNKGVGAHLLSSEIAGKATFKSNGNDGAEGESGRRPEKQLNMEVHDPKKPSEQRLKTQLHTLLS